MLLIQISQIGVALVHALLGLFVLRGQSANAVNRAFAAQSLLFAGWVLGLSGLHNEATVRQSFHLAFAFAVHPATGEFYVEPNRRLNGIKICKNPGAQSRK